jgi:hypothetical protein
MKNNESPLWGLLGQSTGPEKVMHGNVPEGEWQVDFVYPDGQVSVAFSPSFVKNPGMESPDPEIPDDPEQIVCDGIVVKSVYSYDANGGETVIPITPEIIEAFQQWIEDTNFLNVDLYDL